MIRLLALLLSLSLPCGAMVRMAIVIGNNVGLGDEKPLSYATRDAEQVYAALLQLGGVDKGKGYLLEDSKVSDVKLSFTDARNRIRAVRAQGQKVQLLIYFSGHGSEDALHMNGEKLPLSDIRDYFRDSEADLKLLIADACFSGSLIQSKGGTLADPVPVHYKDELKVNGSAILTSSSAGELSQESRELQGSLFTHYFLSAIRGAADADRDGQVTLWEAYNHTQSNLRRKLAGNKSVAQNPEFDVDIHGSENVVLTRVQMGQAFLALKGLPQGEYRILEAVSALQIAEVTLSDPEGALLALPKGPYLVYRGEGADGAAGYADLRRSGTVELGPKDFNPVAMGALTAKGMLGPKALSFLGRTPVQLSLQPRVYPDFPGRARPVWAFDAAVQGNWRNWGLLGSFDWLPRGRSEFAGNVMEQDGYGGAGELRYYWSYSRLGTAFVGPRLEAWSLGQTLNGRDYGRADLLGAFAGLGMEKNLVSFLSFSFTVQAGEFFSYDASGALRRSLAFPMGFALRYGP